MVRHKKDNDYGSDAQAATPISMSSANHCNIWTEFLGVLHSDVKAIHTQYNSIKSESSQASLSAV